jgi:hypothetical protein
MQPSDNVVGTPTALTPQPDCGVKPQKPKVILWKWSLAVVLPLVVWCNSALHSASTLTVPAVRRFHAQLNSGRYDQIFSEADAEFSRSEKHDQFLHLLESVHSKLGHAKSQIQVGLRVTATGAGTFVSAQFASEYDAGQTTETFVWRKTGESLTLYDYKVSPALQN